MTVTVVRSMDELADLVRSERRARGWRQEDLAAQARVSLGTVSNFERKISAPQPGNLRAILRVLELEGQAGDEVASETRSEWEPDVKAFLDVIGIYLSALPDDERAETIRSITRHIVAQR